MKHHVFRASIKPLAFSDRRTSSETPYDNLFTKEQARKLKRIARKRDVPVAKILRDAIEAFVRRHG